jgi:hypothetical protein
MTCLAGSISAPACATKAGTGSSIELILLLDMIDFQTRRWTIINKRRGNRSIGYRHRPIGNRDWQPRQYTIMK